MYNNMRDKFGQRKKKKSYKTRMDNISYIIKLYMLVHSVNIPSPSFANIFGEKLFFGPAHF